MLQLCSERDPSYQELRKTTNHTTQQTSQERFISKEKARRMAASARVRSNKKLGRTQALYRISWGKGGGRAFQGGLGKERLCDLILG